VNRPNRRRRLADETIRIGVALQVVFLLVVDWGTIAGITDEPEVPWLHVAGLATVNIALFVCAVIAWRWMGRAQRNSRRSPVAPPISPSRADPG
jgi:hypothetical protein